MTPEMIAGLAGFIISLAFTYIPGLNVKFAGLVKETQQLIMLALMALVSLGAFGLACAGIAADFGLAVECSQSGAISLFTSFVLAIAANQGTNKVFPKPKAVRIAVQQRKLMS